MSDATTRALDALDESRGKATKQPWYVVGRLSEEEACRIGGIEPHIVSEDGETVAEEMCERNGELACLSVNLAPAMSAVVRAAAEVRDRFEGLGTGSKGALAEWFKARNRLFAALDAFEAKAKEVLR